MARDNSTSWLGGCLPHPLIHEPDSEINIGSYAWIKSLNKLRISTKGLTEVIVIVVVIVSTALRLFDVIDTKLFCTR